MEQLSMSDQVLDVLHIPWSQKFEGVHLGKPRVNENKSKCHRGDKMGKVTLPV